MENPLLTLAASSPGDLSNSANSTSLTNLVLVDDLSVWVLSLMKIKVLLLTAMLAIALSRSKMDRTATVRMANGQNGQNPRVSLPEPSGIPELVLSIGLAMFGYSLLRKKPT